MKFKKHKQNKQTNKNNINKKKSSTSFLAALSPPDWKKERQTPVKLSAFSLENWWILHNTRLPCVLSRMAFVEIKWIKGAIWRRIRTKCGPTHWNGKCMEKVTKAYLWKESWHYERVKSNYFFMMHVWSLGLYKFHLSKKYLHWPMILDRINVETKWGV